MRVAGLTAILLLFSIASHAQSVSRPIITPASGSYEGSTTVTITCATLWAAIYYTTDGSTPTVYSIRYTGPFIASTSQTIRAIALLDRSSIASASYVITAAKFPYTLGASGAGLTFAWQVGAALPIAQALSVWDSSPCPPPAGVPTCHWTATATTDQPWLSATTGVTGFASSVSITPPPTAGVYTGHVTFTQPLFKTPSVTIPVTLTVTAPPVPIVNYQVTLSWVVPTDATGYNVYRSLSPGGPYVTIGFSTTSGFVDTSVVTGKNYSYAVTAMYGSLESIQSNSVSVTIP